MSNVLGVEWEQLLECSIRHLIDSRAEETPDSCWLVDPIESRSYSFRDLQKRAQSVAAMLQSQGYSGGESVGYAMSNSPEAAAVLLGIMYAGCRATAINLVAGPDTIAYVLQHSDSRTVIHDDAGLKALDSALEGSSGHPPQLLRARQCFDQPTHAIDMPAVNADDDALLMYTSGTTGRPKGVRLTHKNLIAGGMNTALAHELNARDRALCVLPLYHINGLCVTLMAPLGSGGSVVMPPSFSVSSFWNTLETEQCSWFSVVPTQISYLLHEPQDNFQKPKKLRFGRSASAPLSPEVQQNFEQRFQLPIVETMGLTETAAQILSNPLPPGTRKIGSPGTAAGNQVMIANPQGKQLPTNQEGEIWVRGANVMRGYLNNPEATAEAISPDGWLRSGDLGKMDDDGYIFVTGRLKELIIKGGENIAPREIDDALYSHPAVIEAAAFARPCENYGQRVEAAVVLSDEPGIDEKGLIDHCLTRVGKFKTPDRVYLLKELPKGPSGKVQRRKLAETYELISEGQST